uniref:Myotubularin-related protein 8 n=1 Tax=Aceria tosichella TaxID=561515 RepID=A0A6G1SH81_9ACAR
MELIRVPKVENVRLVDRLNYANPDVGTLYLTPTHVIFVDPVVKKEHWILLMHVCSVEKLPTTTSGCPLFIKCKHFLHITFIIPKERDALDVYLSLNQLSQPTKLSDLYCFFYNCQDESFERSDGWSNYELESEYNRFLESSKGWTLSDINSNYKICNTYPSKLFVPSCASTDCLIQSARFRSLGRLPVLSYLYTNQAAICRCSQPLSGFNNRSLEDEAMLQHISNANPNKKELYIVDTRPKINAMANRAAGKGYENEQYYLSAKFHFFAIENIHVMRASLNKLLDACNVKQSATEFPTIIATSNWLKHVKSLLDTSNFIAKSIRDGTSVLVHCSDGWDRTAQACSLSSIQLDPYYRTIKGFQALIFKEWLSFGHKFSDRCGHTLSDLRETAPVFTQFLDAVWQMHLQCPTEFEFNEDFLIVIHDHIYSCQFGTFVGNCERERVDLKLSERTYSFWAYLDSHEEEYENPFYDPILNEDDKLTRCAENFLDIDTSPQRIQFWRGLYNRHEHLVHAREPPGSLLIIEKKANQALRERLEINC